MDTQISGGCLCGAVRYEASAGPVFSGNCHCKDCQKTSGGPYVPAMTFVRSTVTFTGTPTWYRSQGDSGHWIERGFCPTCGANIFAHMEVMPELLVIRAGTLDEGSHFKPALDFFVASAQPWDHMDPTLPKRPHSPRG